MYSKLLLITACLLLLTIITTCYATVIAAIVKIEPLNVPAVYINNTHSITKLKQFINVTINATAFVSAAVAAAGVSATATINITFPTAYVTFPKVIKFESLTQGASCTINNLTSVGVLQLVCTVVITGVPSVNTSWNYFILETVEEVKNNVPPSGYFTINTTDIGGVYSGYIPYLSNELYNETVYSVVGYVNTVNQTVTTLNDTIPMKLYATNITLIDIAPAPVVLNETMYINESSTLTNDIARYFANWLKNAVDISNISSWLKNMIETELSNSFSTSLVFNMAVYNTTTTTPSLITTVPDVGPRTTYVQPVTFTMNPNTRLTTISEFANRIQGFVAKYGGKTYYLIYTGTEVTTNTTLKIYNLTYSSAIQDYIGSETIAWKTSTFKFYPPGSLSGHILVGVNVSKHYIALPGGNITLVVYASGVVGNAFVNVTFIPSTIVSPIGNVGLTFYGCKYVYTGPGVGDGIKINWNPITRSITFTDVDEYEEEICTFHIDASNVHNNTLIMILSNITIPTTSGNYTYSYLNYVILYNKSESTRLESSISVANTEHTLFKINSTIVAEDALPLMLALWKAIYLPIRYIPSPYKPVDHIYSITPISNIVTLQNDTINMTVVVISNRDVVLKFTNITHLDKLTSTPSISAIFYINKTSLNETILEKIEKYPNVTIVFTECSSFGCWNITKYQLLDMFAPKVENYNITFRVPAGVVFKAFFENGTYIIPNSSSYIYIVLNVTSYRETSSYSPAYLKIPEVYVNGKSISAECRPIRFVQVGESGINMTEINCTIQTTQIQNMSTISIMLLDNLGRYSWFNITIEKVVVEPPIIEKYDLIKEVGYVVGVENIIAKARFGIYRFNITYISPICNRSILLSPSTLNSSYRLYPCIGGEFELNNTLNIGSLPINISAGALIVGYGEIIAIPPTRYSNCTINITAIGYTLKSSTPILIHVNYGIVPDWYYILYLPKGWDAFSIPGVLVGAWNNILTSLRDVVLYSYCINPGPLKEIKPCNLEDVKPIKVEGFTLIPTTFIVYIKRSTVLIIPVVYYTEVGLPYREIISIEKGTFNIIPIVLQKGTTTNIMNIMTIPNTVELWIYAWDVEAHRFVPVATYMYGTWYATPFQTYIPLGTPLAIYSTGSAKIAILPT